MEWVQSACNNIRDLLRGLFRNLFATQLQAEGGTNTNVQEEPTVDNLPPADNATPAENAPPALRQCIETSQARVSVTTFLQFMKEVAEIGQPWRPIRDGSRFTESPAQHEMFKLLCSLTQISGDAQWGAYSVQHWLRAGAWYLALVSLIPAGKKAENLQCATLGG